ncbi:MAG: hypothetical protein AAF726_08545 [Planctomycetota bacterium]
MKAADDPVSKTLLPALVHEVNNATQLLVGLRALLELPSGEELFAQRANDLARASERMDELGFALAVLATANGADVLLARRHAEALRIVWDLAVRALERGDGGRIAVTGEPPRIAPSALDGWQIPWAAAALVVHASERMGADAWRWRWDDAGRLIGRAAGAIELDEGLLAHIVERIPGGRVDVRGEAIELVLAEDWLAP